jgi:N-acetylneuraminic acid mutarotase
MKDAKSGSPMLHCAGAGMTRHVRFFLSLTLLGLASCAEDIGPTQPSALKSQSAELIASTNTWVSRAPLPLPRWNNKAGVFNGIIYSVGGVGSETDTILAYDVAANTWSSRNSLPDGREAVNGVSAIGGRLYVTGGASPSGPLTKSLFVYNPGSNKWVRKADMPEAGGCGAQGVIAGMLYVYSACSGDRFFRYDPATNTWITLRPPPTSHDFGGSGVIAGKLYLVGGQHVEGGWYVPHAQLDIYDPATDTWTSGAPMPERAMFMASAVLKRELLVAGGERQGVELATLWVYSPATNGWITKAPLPTTRSRAAGAAAGGLFFVIGGRISGTRTRKVTAYTP